MKAGASWITIDFCAVARAVFVLLMVSILLAGLTTGFESVAEPDDTWAVPAVLLAAALNAVLVAVVFPPVAEPSTEAMLESTLAVARIRVVLTRLADGIVLCSVSSEVLEAGLDLTAVALVGRTTAVRVVAAFRVLGAASPLVPVAIALVLRDISLSPRRVSCWFRYDVKQERNR